MNRHKTRPATRSRRRRLGAALALSAGVAMAMAPAALSAGDPVKSGNFRLKISDAFAEQLSRNDVVMKPKAFSLKEGSIDPLTGTGSLTLNGKLRFKHGDEKVVYEKVTAKFGSDGVLKGGGTKLFSLRGGTVVRNGFGADISGVKVKFLKNAAKKLNQKLGLHSLRRVRAGSLSVSEQPQTVEVTGGTVHTVPDPDMDKPGTVASKLFPHCIFGLTDITAISPGIKHPPAVAPTFDFPVTDGTISPQGTDGVVNSAGGIELANTNADIGDCDTAPPPHPATLQQTDSAYNLLNNYISSHLVISGPVPTAGDHGVGIGSNLNVSNATVSADPDNHTVTINGIVVTNNGGSSLFLNQTFLQPSTSFQESNQFVSGDLFGTVDLSVRTR